MNFDIKERVRMIIPDKIYLKFKFRRVMGYPLNLKNPITYNEKLQWLKLYDHNELYEKLVDKYEVKDYVKSIIGDEYIIPTYGVWDKFDDIDFDALPNEFVLKCTHDSGGLVICKDKNQFDIKTAKEKIERCLKRNYFYLNREWPYKNVKARIIAERYLPFSDTNDLKDYKFFCFDGKVKALFVASDRNNESQETKFDFFDEKYNPLNIVNGHPNSEVLPEKPESFEKMVELAERISCGLVHARIDFYEFNGRPLFGEVTLSHWGGFKKFYPEKWDRIFGDWIQLPQISKKKKI